MDNKRTRLRSQAAGSKVVQTVFVPTHVETLQRIGDVVEVEVEGEQYRGLPIVRGVNKRKRDPRGAGKRLQQKLEQEGSVSVFVDEDADNEGRDEMKRSERYGSKRSAGVSPALSRPGAVASPQVSTYVIIPEIMPEDQAVMKQLDRRRESSRPRVKPSKFREGFLLSSTKPKGEQKGADDGTTSLEIVLPMDALKIAARRPPADSNPKASSSRASESDIESSLDRPSQNSTGRNKFKITYRAGSAKATERQGNAADSLSAAKTGSDDHGLKAALAVVKRVMQIKSAEPFNEPVDPVALKIPDYLAVIKAPMDLGTIRELLEGGKKYKTAQDVYADVQLVWRNCRSYNQEGDPIMDILKIAENCFNKHWNAAGLQISVPATINPKAQKREESNREDSSDELIAPLEQRGGEEAKRRKSKDTKVVAKLNLRKIVHFDTSNPRLKTKRSASVEQVMAESKAREEDKLDVEDVEVIKGDSNFVQGYADDEVVEEEETLQKAVDEWSLTPEEVDETQTGGQAVEEEVDATKGIEEEQAEVDRPIEQEAKTPLQDKDNTVRVSSSNKRRTFGTVHHKLDCTCVVCVGRRRKLARQEREGIVEGKKEKKEKKETAISHSPHVQGSPQVAKAHASRVSRPPKPPQVQEALTASVSVSLETEAVECNQPESQMGNALEVEPMVEGVRYYPATYELPLRKVNPSLLQLSQVLFGNHQNSFRRRHHSLGYQLPPSMSKSSMFEAVHSLTLNER